MAYNSPAKIDNFYTPCYSSVAEVQGHCQVLSILEKPDGFMWVQISAALERGAAKI